MSSRDERREPRTEMGTQDYPSQRSRQRAVSILTWKVVEHA